MKWLIIPLSQFSLPADACVEGPATFTYEGETKPYVLHITDNADQIADWCGVEAQACIRGHDIYVPEPCEKHLAHELNHKFGMDFVDGPKWKDSE